MPGPHRTVMPNTGASMPSNPTPTVDNTREDDKPLPKSVREGLGTAKQVRRQTKEQKKQVIQAKLKAKQKREKEEQEDNASLGGNEDNDKPLVPPKQSPR